mgnify:CR=1 FL=1
MRKTLYVCDACKRESIEEKGKYTRLKIMRPAENIEGIWRRSKEIRIELCADCLTRMCEVIGDNELCES